MSLRGSVAARRTESPHGRDQRAVVVAIDRTKALTIAAPWHPTVLVFLRAVGFVPVPMLARVLVIALVLSAAVLVIDRSMMLSAGRGRLDAAQRAMAVPRVTEQCR